MDDIPVALEHVDLFNSLNRLDIQLLESALELLLVGARALMDLLNLSSHGALAAMNTMSDGSLPVHVGL